MTVVCCRKTVRTEGQAAVLSTIPCHFCLKQQDKRIRCVLVLWQCCSDCSNSFLSVAGALLVGGCLRLLLVTTQPSHTLQACTLPAVRRWGPRGTFLPSQQYTVLSEPGRASISHSPVQGLTCGCIYPKPWGAGCRGLHAPTEV